MLNQKATDIYNEIYKRLQNSHLICLNDFIEEGSLDASFSIDQLIEDLGKEEKRNLNWENYSILKYSDYGKIKGQEKLGGLKNNKTYIKHNSIEVRFITDIHSFLNEFSQKFIVKSIQNEFNNTIEKKPQQRQSIMSKLSNVDLDSEFVYADAKEKLKYIYYRGHNSVNYVLSPSIHRKHYLFHEKEMYYELISKKPGDFSESKRHIDILRKMQHYNFNTRLLDITSNALVGLFFAINGDESSNKDDSELIVFQIEPKLLKHNYSDSVEILSALATLSYEKKIELAHEAKIYVEKLNNIDNKINQKNTDCSRNKLIDEFNQKTIVKILLHEIRTAVGNFEPLINPRNLFECLFVRTLQDNERIIRQDGLFILCGLEYPYDEKDNNAMIEQTLNSHRLKINYTSNKAEAITRFIIPSEFKQRIRFELSLLGIDEDYVYPELSSVAKRIRNDYS